ncbi:MAG: c-type cytochrome [Nitrospirales bacterium]|nr:c-type cytochrome [Nitrospirales bacterium]
MKQTTISIRHNQTRMMMQDGHEQRQQSTSPRLLAFLGGAILWGMVGTVWAQDAVPEGFKVESLPPAPAADQIEAGKRVYFTKCVWCHGVDGAGDGPGADRLWPRPRNFNAGTFKIRHTASGELPLIDVDLFQTVTHGLPGSAMPSWEGILTDKQRKDVLAFVTAELVKDRSWQDSEFETLTVLELDKLAASATPPTPESIKHGSELVVEKKCIECHGLEGRGDGNAFNLKDDWGFSIQPADWHKCWNFRGSRQDPYNVKNIFRTFSTGVNGTPMPSFADSTSVADRWDLANYVNSLCERENEINIDGGKVTDEIAQELSTGKALSVDILTDKPKANFVVPSKYLEGELPTDELDERWKTVPRRWIALGGQITHKPRNFVNRIDDAWVQSAYNETHIQFLFQWDDRTKSIAEEELEWDPTEVNLEDYGVVEQPPGGTKFEDDPEHPESIAWRQNKYTVYNDGIAFEFPIKWQELPFPRKPRYLWGDEKFAMDITKWTADGNLRAFEGTGWDQDFSDRDMTDDLKLVKAEWKDGRWTVLIQRPIKRDYEADAWLEAGKYIPLVFFAWDGHNGDAGRKMAVSAFYYLVMEPPIPQEAYIYPVLMGIGLVGIEGWVLTRRRNRREGKLDT